MIQLDEPKQKNCVYKLQWQDETKEPEEQEITKFFQIRVKSIKFLQAPAIAIYIYDVTLHIQ